jgi:tRNA-dihydrouridine synthase
MAEVELNLEKLTIPEKVALMQRIIAAMTDNPNFPTAQPLLQKAQKAVDELIDAYNEAQTAREAARTMITILSVREAQLRQLILRGLR